MLERALRDGKKEKVGVQFTTEAAGFPEMGRKMPRK